MKMKIYGCRGSLAYSRDSYFGGNTSCMTVESGDDMIIFDAGSGIMKLDAELRKKYVDYPSNLPFKPSILISHLHLDHILGLVGFAPIWKNDTHVKIYTCSRSNESINEQIFGAFKPPYWPVPLSELSYAEAEIINISETFKIGDISVTPFIANHPNDTISFHITDGVSSIVHLLDNEIFQSNKTHISELLLYCHNADLVIFDAAYLPKDYEKKIGWGHSTIEYGITLADICDCKRMMFAHFSQEYTDDELRQLENIVPSDGRFIFAYEGLTIEL